MSRYIMFSFDDGREDTYRNAYRILKKFGFVGTINITSDFILHEKNYKCFKTCLNKSMSKEEILECQINGWEIAAHGSTHTNNIDDLLFGIQQLKEMGVDVKNIGFASPGSYLTEYNNKDFMNLVNNGRLAYIRSGLQTRREGYIFILLTLINRLIHNKYLFYLLRNKVILKNNKKKFILSLGITKYTSLNEVIYFLNKLNDNEGVILAFHSILSPDDKGYDVDKRYWDCKTLEGVCSYLYQNKKYIMIKTIDWFNDNNKM